MKKNLSSTDRMIRIVLAATVGILYFAGIINGTAAIVLGIVAIVFLATSLVNFCPLYAALGLSTNKKSE